MGAEIIPDRRKGHSYDLNTPESCAVISERSVRRPIFGQATSECDKWRARQPNCGWTVPEVEGAVSLRG